MLFKGIMIARASGRLGDSVWAYNRGGPYVRTMGNPNPNPPTDTQAAARAAYASCIASWADLTPGQRNGWDRLSIETPEAGRAGTVRPAGAFPLFVRANQIRFMTDALMGTALSTVPDAPDQSSVQWPGPLPTAEADGESAITITYPMDVLFPTQDTAALLIWSSLPRNATQRSHRNVGWKMQYPLPGHDRGFITIPLDTTVFNPGHTFLRLRLVTDKGEITPPMILDVVGTDP